MTKISLNKKDRIIASETINCRERRLSNERFEAIQKERQIKEKKKNKLLVLKNYTLIYIVVFDDNIFFE